MRASDANGGKPWGNQMMKKPSGGFFGLSVCMKSWQKCQNANYVVHKAI